jgi:gamma-glutamyl-gamma-aminobutyrate hydrolase PuuD
MRVEMRERRRPLIGVTTYTDTVTWGVWTLEAAMSPLSYVTSIERAGGRALLVPTSEDGVEETLDALDGLILAGGEDLHPELYDADPHPETQQTRPERDRAELALLAGALARDMPVLAVCRGSQVLNVGLGGDLDQHLPDTLGSDRHRHTPGAFADHDVELKVGSRLADLLGERAPVKSHHHQGYRRLGDGLEPVAWAEDGTIEGLELPGKRFALGVLWHPEEGEDLALFEALVREAAAYHSAARLEPSTNLKGV